MFCCELERINFFLVHFQMEFQTHILFYYNFVLEFSHFLSDMLAVKTIYIGSYLIYLLIFFYWVVFFSEFPSNIFGFGFRFVVKFIVFQFGALL